MKFCPRCGEKMIKQLGIYGFYYVCNHCRYTIFVKNSEVDK